MGQGHLLDQAAKIGLQAVERPKRAAQTERAAGHRHGQAELAADEAGTNQARAAEVSQRHEPLAERGRQPVECCVRLVGIDLEGLIERLIRQGDPVHAVDLVEPGQDQVGAAARLDDLQPAAERRRQLDHRQQAAEALALQRMIAAGRNLQLGQHESGAAVMAAEHIADHPPIGAGQEAQLIHAKEIQLRRQPLAMEHVADRLAQGRHHDLAQRFLIGGRQMMQPAGAQHGHGGRPEQSLGPGKPAEPGIDQHQAAGHQHQADIADMLLGALEIAELRPDLPAKQGRQALLRRLRPGQEGGIDRHRACARCPGRSRFLGSFAGQP